MDNLAKLFESVGKVKIMKFFLMHQGMFFTIDEIVEKTRLKKDIVRKELNKLITATLINKKQYTQKNTKSKTRKQTTYIVNQKCSYRRELHNLFAEQGIISDTELLSRFKKVGKVDLLVSSGIFMKLPDSRIDLLIVGTKLKKQNIENTISILESEIGTEITYAVFETSDFLYRAHMYDKLIREVLDSKNTKLFDSGILSQVPNMS